MDEVRREIFPRTDQAALLLRASAQDHTPFQGVSLKGWPVRTLLRGTTVYRDGEVIGPPSGRFLERPIGAVEAKMDSLRKTLITFTLSIAGSAIMVSLSVFLAFKK